MGKWQHFVYQCAVGAMNKNREYDKIPCFSYLSDYTIYGGEGFWGETGCFSNKSKVFKAKKMLWYYQKNYDITGLVQPEVFS